MSALPTFLSPLAIASLLSLLLAYIAIRRRTAIRDIPGPPLAVVALRLQLILPKKYGEHEVEWQKSYGTVYRIKGCFGQNRLMVSDPVAIRYILNSQRFKHSPMLENLMHLCYGPESFVCVIAKEHRSLRAAMNVGFTAAARLTVAAQLSEELDKAGTGAINICPLLGFASLSTIAVLGQSPDELGNEFMQHTLEIGALSASRSRGQVIADALGSHIPAWIFRAAIYLPTKSFKAIRKSRRLAHEIGTTAVWEKVAAARNGLDVDGNVYGLLLKNGLPGSVVAAQTAIMTFAGQDTTATTLAFGLRELAKMPRLQEKLRAEITAHRVVVLERVLLNAKLLKETLRMYPALPLDDLVAIEATNIPLGHEITTSTGQQISQIYIQKGQLLSVAIASFQRLVCFSRWLDGRAYKEGEALGPYANLLTFLGGPHTCLGWRFAILEMQVFICELVANFSFALPESDTVSIQFVNTLIPWMANGRKGAPLRVTRVQ
ncbi:cytochrome P450 [Mycena filopes]|nr:cytochrome P450 [Mycena filopes]KAJ7161741.1 cytochrome P450 [Mycena filopes]